MILQGVSEWSLIHCQKALITYIKRGLSVWILAINLKYLSEIIIYEHKHNSNSVFKI